MPLPTASPRAASAVRLLTILAIVVGLFGMHVLTSPASHAAHGSPSAISVESGGATASEGAVHAPHSAAMTSGADAMAGGAYTSSARSCADGCAGAANGSGGSAWAVACVLVLLLTALLVAPRPSSWLMPWSDLRLLVAASRDAVDRAPRHPPSLIVLSISRT